MAFVFGAALTVPPRAAGRLSGGGSSLLGGMSTTATAGGGGGRGGGGDIVGELQNEEQRLLEMLAATRSKMKSASEAQHVQNSKRRYHQRSGSARQQEEQPQPQQQQQQQQQQQRQQQHGSQHRGGGPAERLSLPAVSTRVVPILSSTGEPVFEVGLNGSSANEHILPVFRLPEVDESTADFVNRIPTELNAVEAEREEEEERDDEELAASLGLSLEELAEFQMEAAEKSGNKRALRRAWESQRSLMSRDGMDGPGGSRVLSSTGSQHHFDGGASALRPEGLPELQLGPLNGEESSAADLDRLTGGPLKRRRPNNVDAHGSRRTPRCLRPGASASRAQLRGELKKSIDMIHFLTEQVREDIARVHETVPIQSVKAQLFMQRWGLEKFQKIFFRIQMSFLIAAFRKWRNTIEHMKHEEKRQSYMKLKASKNLKHLGNRLRNKEIHHAFTIWCEGVERQRRAEEFERADAAVRKIQSAARAYIARVVMRDLKARLKREEERGAATKIQAMYRGRSTRKQVAELLTQIEMRRAVCCVQRAWRGRMGRIMYRETQRQAAILRATLLVQNAWRGRHARAMMAAMRTNRKRNDAATVLQSHFRRMLARKSLGSRRERARQDRAAAKIQARIRGKMARRSVSVLAKDRDKQRDKENKAATLIQKTYRARKAYITYMLKLQAHRASMVKLHAAATRVQSIYRGRLARRLVADMSGDNHDEMVERAREYVEIWDEESQGYFYYRAVDEQAIWEPPASGYTKADGKLVLRNGEVIPDPAVDPAANAKKCIECETELAARYCVDCDDNYCDSCFDKTHNAGKRALHSWEPIGPTRCMECEQEVATRWCDTCDDPYCESCFKTIHSKGKKARHKWTPIGEEKTPEEDPEQAGGEYNAGGAGGVDGFMNAEAENAWEEHWDDEANCAYWYNATTGESSYSNPFGDAAADAALGYSSAEAYQTDYDGAVGYDDAGGGGGTTQDWQELFDENSGQSYWYSESTGETVWTNPWEGGGGGGAVGAEGYDAGAYGAEGYSSADAGGWAEAWDDDGNQYWYNEATGDTSYESPW